MAHEFDFKKKFSDDLKTEIIERRKNELMTICTEKQALRRAKHEIMPDSKWNKYAKITQFICDQHNIPTDSDNISMSTNRNGEHSWYIMTKNMAIRISDHLKKSYVDIDSYHIQIIIDKSKITLYLEDCCAYAEKETTLKTFGIDYFKFIIECIGRFIDWSRISAHKESFIEGADKYTKDFYVPDITEKTSVVFIDD